MEDQTTQSTVSTSVAIEKHVYQLRGSGDTTGQVKAMTVEVAALANSDRTDGKQWTRFEGKSVDQHSPATVTTAELTIAPPPAAANPFELIDVARIVVPSGRTPLGNASAVADSFVELGQLQPIGLRFDEFEQSHILMYGATRLAAAKLLGWQTIAAKVVETDDVRAQLAEIDENLVRGKFTALAEAQQLARRKELYEALHPEAKAGAVRAARMNGRNVGADSAPTFSEDTAAKTGHSQRTIQNDVRIASNLDPAAADTIRNTPTADNKTALKELSDAPPEQQRKAAKKLAAGTANNVADALKDEPSADVVEPAPPFAPFNERVHGVIKKLRSNAIELREALQYNVDGEGNKFDSRWAHYYSHAGTIGAINTLIRNLESGLPEKLCDEAPGFLSANLVKTRAATAPGGAR